VSVRFAGYAAVFDRVDRGGDVIRRGAFAGLRAPVPLLWQHRGAPVGSIDRLAEDDQGLRVIGSVSDPAMAARLTSGAIDGLSFGYRVKEARHGAARELLALDLVEVSLVAAPMQPLARIHAVEAA